MRAVKTVITAAGNLKQLEPNNDEMILLLRALQDVNLPKFLEMDIPLFEGIIRDLFPGKFRPALDYGALMKTMKYEISKAGLQVYVCFYVYYYYYFLFFYTANKLFLTKYFKYLICNIV